MKASELIEKLQTTLNGAGDIEIKIAIESNHGYKVSDVDGYKVVGDEKKGKKIWLVL